MDYASAGSGYEMDAIAAVIVGGTSMSGGKAPSWVPYWACSSSA